MAVVSGLVLRATGPTISSGRFIFEQLRAHSFARVVARPSSNGAAGWAQNEHGAKVRPMAFVRFEVQRGVVLLTTRCRQI